MPSTQGVHSFKAGENISQFRVVQLDSSSTGTPKDAQVKLPDAADVRGFGVSQETSDSGQAIPIQTVPGETTKFTLGSGTVDVGDDLAVADTAGRVKKAAGSGAKEDLVGECTEAATNVGEEFRGVYRREQRNFT